MKKTAKKALIILSAVVGVILLGLLYIILFCYSFDPVNIQKYPYRNEDGYLTGYCDSAMLNGMTSGLLVREKTYENFGLLSKSMMEPSHRFRERFGDYTQIDCRVLEESFDTVSVAYTGEGVEKDSGKRIGVNILAEYHMGLWDTEPTVTYSSYDKAYEQYYPLD